MKTLRDFIPRPMRTWLGRRRKQAERSLLIFDRVTDWSLLRRVHPHRLDFGDRRGECIDRYYIEKFLFTFQPLVHGHVAEIGSDHYTRLIGGALVERSDVIDLDSKNPKRTVTLDLTHTPEAPENAFDCIICTQTLFEIYDFRSALRSLYKMVKPAGVVLATIPGISQGVRGSKLGGAGDDWWRFTERSARRVFGEVFSDENVVVHTYGNVLTATAFLHGLVQAELTQDEFEYHDPDYEVIIGVKATKPHPE